MRRTKKPEVPFTRVRQNLTAIIDEVEKTGKPVTILRRGKPAAVIISHEMYEQQVTRTKPFRLAGSVRIASGVDIDKALAKAKRKRIESWNERVKRLREAIK